MSRHGYSEDGWDDQESQWASIRWAGQVRSAIRGKRGQAFLVALVEALDSLPEKRLIAESLQDEGEVCALGALGRHRGIDMRGLDPEDSVAIGETFGIARQLACEVMYQNDENSLSPEERWRFVRAWALRQINPETLVPEDVERQGDL
ncbi:MAG TPA: hypothetical protein VFR23_24415 [Jiangellaceae bacterium]|nr:hypothetical protein [Jiangellaceae bacterium]